MGTRAGAGGWGLYPGRRARPRLASLAEPPSPAHGPARALRPGSPLLPPLPRLPPSPAGLRGILLARILLALPSFQARILPPVTGPAGYSATLKPPTKKQKSMRTSSPAPGPSPSDFQSLETRFRARVAGSGRNGTLSFSDLCGQAPARAGPAHPGQQRVDVLLAPVVDLRGGGGRSSARV